MLTDRLITVAIHTYDRAHRLKTILEGENIPVTLQNVNLTNPSISAGVRVRIKEHDLPQALRIIENIEILAPGVASPSSGQHGGTLLVPTDFSEESLRAAIVAFRIAASIKANVHLLHTFIDPSFTGDSVMQLSDTLTFDAPDPVGQMEEERTIAHIATKGMKDFSEKIRDKIRAGVIPGVHFTTEVTEGLPEEAIDQYSTIHRNILTVMGNHGADSPQRDMVGSVTAEVLDNGHCAVLSVPSGTPWDQSGMPASTLFFASPSQDDILALDTLYRLFPDTALSVTIVAASKPSSTQTAQLDSLLKFCRTSYPAFTFKVSAVSLDNPIEDLDKLSANKPFDLIVVGNKRKNMFSRLFNPTLAHRLLFHTDIPLLAIPVKG